MDVMKDHADSRKATMVLEHSTVNVEQIEQEIVSGFKLARQSSTSDEAAIDAAIERTIVRRETEKAEAEAREKERLRKEEEDRVRAKEEAEVRRKAMAERAMAPAPPNMHRPGSMQGNVVPPPPPRPAQGGAPPPPPRPAQGAPPPPPPPR